MTLWMRPNGCRHKVIFVTEVHERAALFIAEVTTSLLSAEDI